MADRSPETRCLILDLRQVPASDVVQREVIDAPPASPWSYAARLGRETISLDYVEYRILSFLASKPYHAFTTRRIIEAVTTERHPVTEQTLDRHIASLRAKLGFFADYIQSVPYIGYRFKE
jgi:DNA-binding response OmpR family regulator